MGGALAAELAAPGVLPGAAGLVVIDVVEVRLCLSGRPWLC